MEDEVKEGAVRPLPDRPSDQEVEDQHQAELDAEREEHNRKTGGGKYPVAEPTKHSYDQQKPQ